MPRIVTIVTIVALAVLATLALLYATGGLRVVQIWAIEGQETAQTSIARALRALRMGEPAAFGALMAVSFGYGFFHAAGPGHGKLLIGGYGAARAVGAVKLSLVALAASVAQALSAIALVGAGLLVLGWGRERMTDLAEDVFAPVSFGAIALIGLWLVWRGARGLRALPHSHDHEHIHDPAHDTPHAAHDHACGSCGHAHAPDPARLAAATGWRDIAALIGAVAIRPCTGALFLLILTAQMDIFASGVAGTFAMALGTASVTMAVALAAVTLRRGALAGLVDSPLLARAQPTIEIAVGALIALVAGQLTLSLLA